MKYLAILLLLIPPTLNYSQTQPQRVEIEVNAESKNHELIPVKSNGIIAFMEGEKLSQDFDNWIFTLYNTDFKKVWEKKIDIKSRLSYSSYHLDNQFLYLLFTNSKVEEYLIIKIHVPKGELREIKGYYLKKFIISCFKVKGDQLYVDGSYRSKVMLGYIDLKSGIFKIIPTIFEGITSIENISFEKEGDVAHIVFLSWIKKKSYLSICSFRNGEKINSLNIRSEDGRNIITARLNMTQKDERIIIGTYSESGRSSNGMYICKFQNNSQQFIRFYNFNDLKNFLNYLPKKRQEILKGKIEKREAQGKKLNFDYNLLVHDIIEREDEYLLIAEAYYATYRTESYTTFVPGPNGTMLPMTRYRQVFDGWLYSHALIGGISKEGELKWDNTFEMGDFKSYTLKERITVNTEGPKIILAYASGYKIRSKIIDGSKVLDNKDYEAIETKNEEDKISYSTSTIEYWFDKYYIAYGYQKIRNNEEDKKKRMVFFFNKISYN